MKTQLKLIEVISILALVSYFLESAIKEGNETYEEYLALYKKLTRIKLEMINEEVENGKTIW